MRRLENSWAWLNVKCSTSIQAVFDCVCVFRRAIDGPVTPDCSEHVCGCGHRGRQLFGVCARAGALQRTSEPLACVCIFMQGFEVVLLNASFGCIGKLFFNLAWQAYGLGFASAYLWVSMDMWDWGLWCQGFHLRENIYCYWSTGNTFLLCSTWREASWNLKCQNDLRPTWLRENHS